jgi:hypothetical protein
MIGVAIDVQEVSTITKKADSNLFFNFPPTILGQPPNGLRYLRWGGDGEAVQPEK